MNPKDPLNDIFQKLGDSSSTDLSAKDRIWARLEEKLDQQQPLKIEPKTSFPWKWVAAAMVILSAGGIFYYNYDNSTAKISKEQIVALEEKAPEISSAEKESSLPFTALKDQDSKLADQKQEIINPQKTIAYQVPEPTYKVVQERSYNTASSYAPIEATPLAAPIAAPAPVAKEEPVNIPAPTAMRKSISTETASADRVSDEKLKEVSTTTDKSAGYVASTKKAPTNVYNSLEGRVSGVTITDTGKTEDPAIAFTRIRGVASQQSPQALIVVDSFVFQNYDINSLPISSDKIESVTVIKGAQATALYGAAAQNGAIVIKTKNLKRTDRKALKSAYMQQQLNLAKDSLK